MQAMYVGVAWANFQCHHCKQHGSRKLCLSGPIAIFAPRAILAESSPNGRFRIHWESDDPSAFACEFLERPDKAVPEVGVKVGPL